MEACSRRAHHITGHHVARQVPKYVSFVEAVLKYVSVYQRDVRFISFPLFCMLMMCLPSLQAFYMAM